MPDDWDFSQKRRGSAVQLPIITYGLVALCVVLTLAHWYAESTPGVAPLFARINAFVAPTSWQIWDGAYYGLLTTFFAHGDWMHLIFNMMMFVQLGRLMEAELPPWAYFLFLAGAALVSSGCELAATGGAGIGASGVVYAMFALMWIGRARYGSWTSVATRQNLNIFIAWGVFCVFGTYAGFMHIANVAHGSGFLFGLSVGYLLLAPRRQMVFAAPLVLMTLLALLSVRGLPWSAEWYTYRAHKAFEAEQYRSAIDYHHKSLRLGGSRYNNWENIKRAWQNIGIEAERRNDIVAYEEAARQAASAERLEGPDPSKAPDQPGLPTFRGTAPKP